MSYYLEHLLLMTNSNKVRVALTSIGIFIAVFLFSSGNIIANSYYNSRFVAIDDMIDTSMVVSNNSCERAITEYAEKSLMGVAIRDASIVEYKSIYSALISADQYINVMAKLHGVSATDRMLPVTGDDGSLIPVKIDLLEGRLFVSQDLVDKSRVVVIDELTANIISPGESCVGKTITVGVSISGASIGGMDAMQQVVTMKVVGIIKNTNQAEANRIKALKEKQSGENNIFLNTSIYCPISTLIDLFPNSTKQTNTLYYFDEPTVFDDFYSFVEGVRLSCERSGELINVTTKRILLDKIEKDHSYTKLVLNLITAVLCVISAISIMGVVFFSIKERIPEIGIRRAFGASKTDIAFQLMLEMITIAFVASVAAVIVSFYLCKIAEVFMISNFFVSFKISAGAAQLILPVLVGIAEAIVCSIVPGLYAANIKVTDALKFE